MNDMMNVGNIPDFPQEVGAERTIQAVALEINTLHNQSQQIVLGYAIEIGRRLREAKGMLAHGEWGDWLKTQVPYSKSTANNLMRIFEEYGASQMNLFGTEAKSQAIGNLQFTKALKLLAVPEDEREDFLEEHNVEEMSSRELERVIREKTQAEADRETAEKLAEKLKAEKEMLELQTLSAEKRAEELEADLTLLQDSFLDTEEQLNLLKNSPVEVAVETVIDHEAMEQAKRDARAEMERELEEKINEIQAIKEAQAHALQDAEVARNQLEALSLEKSQETERVLRLEEQLASIADKKPEMSSNVVVFKVHFLQFQENMNKMIQIIKDTDPSEGEKLKKALTQVLETSIAEVRHGD